MISLYKINVIGFDFALHVDSIIVRPNSLFYGVRSVIEQGSCHLFQTVAVLPLDHNDLSDIVVPFIILLVLFV